MLRKPLCVILFLFVTTSHNLFANDITEFDYPFLLGDWYWFSPNENGVQSQGENYRAMHIQFKSSYDFKLRLLRADGKVEQWSGNYDIDDANITFIAADEPEQKHNYQLSYNKFSLDGARFTKLVPEHLSGNWRLSHISGQDVDSSISGFRLSLRPDFLFSSKTTNKAGKTQEHKGIYYIEDDQIVLLYKEGQQKSRFMLSGNETLTLSNKGFGMKMVLKRE